MILYIYSIYSYNITELATTYVKQMCIRNFAHKGTTAYYFDIVR